MKQAGVDSNGAPEMASQTRTTLQCAPLLGSGNVGCVAMFSREIEMFLREMEILTFMPIPLLFFKKKHWIFKTKFIIGLRGQFSTLVLIYQGNSP